MADVKVEVEARVWTVRETEETNPWDSRHLDTTEDCEDGPRWVDGVLMVAWGSRSGSERLGPEPGPNSDLPVSEPVSRVSSQRSSDLLPSSQAVL